MKKLPVASQQGPRAQRHSPSALCFPLCVPCDVNNFAVFMLHGRVRQATVFACPLLPFFFFFVKRKFTELKVIEK